MILAAFLLGLVLTLLGSMAGAALFLPFLPMLPVQVLLNNLLYDLSELPIPMDAVAA